MNPLLGKLQPYPFEKLRALIAGNTPPAHLHPINLQIGEPKVLPDLEMAVVLEKFRTYGQPR